jgi:outer membrane lipoprotein-sorting protein
MNRRTAFLLLAAPLCAALAQDLPSVDDLVAKHLKAVGGADKLKAIKSAKITASTEMNGMEFTTTVYLKRPGLMRSDTSVQGQTIVQAFDGQKSWSVNPLMGSADPAFGSEEESKQARDRAISQLDGHLVDYKEKGSKIEVQGKEDVEGSPAYKLKVTTKDGDVIYEYIDAATYLDTKMIATVKQMGQQMEVTSLPTNYKPEGGVMMPHQVEQRVGPMSMKMVVQKIEVNVPVEDAMFQMPAKGDAKKQ